MADNVVLDAGAGGDTIAADDVGGVKYQVVKLAVGADGAASLVANANPIPVSDAGGTITVDGTVAVTNAGLTALNGAIAGTEVQVDVLTMPSVAVTNAGLTELAAAINASSQMDVNIAASAATVAVSNAGLTELAAAINGSSQLDVNVAAGGISGVVEDAASAGGEEGIMVLAVRRDVASSGVGTDGDFAALSVTSDGSLRVSGSSGTTQYAEDVASAGAESLCLAGAIRRDTAAVGSGTDGDYSTLNVDSTGRLWCNVSNTVTVASHAVTNAGTFATQAACAGVAADDAATSGNPVLIAGVAVETDGTDPTTVSAEGDAAYLRTDRARNLLVNVTHPRFWHVSADYGAAQTNASVKAAPGASLSLYITDLVISNGATAGNVTLLDGSGGTVVFELYPAINGGISKEFRNPIKLTANTALCITSTTVTTHSIFVSGYIAP